MGQDFTVPQTTVTFAVGTPTGDTQPVLVNVIDDDEVEGTESLLLTGIVAPPASFVGGPATVNIIDDDGKCVWNEILLLNFYFIPLTTWSIPVSSCKEL